MQETLDLLCELVPELTDHFKLRMEILQVLRSRQKDISRKNLALRIGITERQTRSHLDVLRNNHLIEISQQGVRISQAGIKLFDIFQSHLSLKKPIEFHQMEKALKAKLQIEDCLIIKGDADFDNSVYNIMGEFVQRILIKRLPLGNALVAVTGGSTLARISESFSHELSKNRQITFIPSRGGMGGNYQIQSNSVGSRMAEKTGAKYLPLFIPEMLGQETSELLLKDPSIHRIVDLSKQADGLILSIGRAEVMAERREVSQEQYQAILDYQAVGEAFGVFYDVDGQEVVRYPRIGLTIEDLDRIPLLITVVGGSSKAKAVEGFFRLAPNRGYLVCDEGVAQSILNGETL